MFDFEDLTPQEIVEYDEWASSINSSPWQTHQEHMNKMFSNSYEQMVDRLSRRNDVTISIWNSDVEDEELDIPF